MDLTNIPDMAAKLSKYILQPITFCDAVITIVDITTPTYIGFKSQIAEHSHPWFEFYYFTAGDFHTVIDGIDYHTFPDDYLLVKPGGVHLHFQGEAPVSRQLVIRFQVSHTDSSEPMLYNKIISALLEAPVIFNAQLERLQLSGDGSYSDKINIWNYLIDLLKPGTEETGSDSSTNITYQVDMYLNENYNRTVYMTELSTALNMSYRQISRIYKKHNGYTLVDKLTDIRFNKARDLLINTSMPIKEIARAVGFENEYYFSGLFKKKWGRTPTLFRKRMKDLQGLENKSKDRR